MQTRELKLLIAIDTPTEKRAMSQKLNTLKYFKMNKSLLMQL